MRERERKLKEKAFKAISGWPWAMKAQCVKSLKVKGSLWTKRLNQLFFFCQDATNKVRIHKEPISPFISALEISV